MKMRVKLGSMLLLSFAFKVFAADNLSKNLSADLSQFFEGISSNVTKAQAYESQAGGYYGAGSVFARTPVRQYSLITLDMPHFRAGCAGIDLYNGSLSYISGDKIRELGRQIMQNSGAYAIDVMLATTVPELKQVRDFLQTTVQKVNQANINSCEMAQNLVGGLWPRTLASQQKVCHDQRLMGKSGLASDYVQARMDCSGSRYQATMEDAMTDDVRSQEVVLNKNIVWELLKKQNFFDENTELSELVMNLTGSIIIDKNGHVQQIPSQASNMKLIHLLLGDVQGAHSAMIWHCVEKDKCLSVVEKTITLDASHSFVGKVKAIIEAIDAKIKTDNALSAYEKSFLEVTPLPVLKFLLVLNGTQYGNAAADIESYATLIASDILGRYLSEILNFISRQTYGTAIPDALLKELRARIEKAHQSINLIEPNINQKFMQKMNLIEQISKVEKQLSASTRVE